MKTVSDKYEKAAKTVVDNYVRGLTHQGWMPDKPSFYNAESAKILIEAMDYALKEPSKQAKISAVSDFVVRACRYGVFPNRQVAHDYLTGAKKLWEIGLPNSDFNVSLNMKTWDEMDDDERSSVSLPDIPSASSYSNRPWVGFIVILIIAFLIYSLLF